MCTLSEIQEPTHIPPVPVHVVGLGAVGTLLAVALAKAGFSVHTYGGTAAPRRCLTVRHAGREETVVVTDHPATLPHVQEKEAVIVAVKWPHLQTILSAIGPTLSSGNPLLLPQNGMVDVELRSFAKTLTLVPIVVHASALTIERGTVVANGNAEFLVRDDAPLPRTPNLEKEGFRFLPEREFRIAQILKLLIACTSAKMALRQMSIGAAFRDPYFRNELAAIAREAASVLATYYEGDPCLKSEADNLVQRIALGMLVDVDSLERAYTSLHYDLNVHHQETEAPWLNGFVNRLARHLRILAPLNNSILKELARPAALARCGKEKQ